MFARTETSKPVMAFRFLGNVAQREGTEAAWSLEAVSGVAPFLVIRRVAQPVQIELSLSTEHKELGLEIALPSVLSEVVEIEGLHDFLPGMGLLRKPCRGCGEPSRAYGSEALTGHGTSPAFRRFMRRNRRNTARAPSLLGRRPMAAPRRLTDRPPSDRLKFELAGKTMKTLDLAPRAPENRGIAMANEPPVKAATRICLRQARSIG